MLIMSCDDDDDDDDDDDNDECIRAKIRKSVGSKQSYCNNKQAYFWPTL